MFSQMYGDKSQSLTSRVKLNRELCPELYKYRLSEAEKERVNTLIKMYEGKHKYHNFTRQITAKDPQAYRFIHRAKAFETLVFGGIEFIRITIRGQSFLYNQIRKMIGMIFLIMHYELPDSLITEALTSYQFNIPIAPAEGLMLNRVFTDSYNKNKTEIPEVIEPWESKKEELHKFRLSLVRQI
jgi:tRNA pseudouridine38-40 synthase